MPTSPPVTAPAPDTAPAPAGRDPARPSRSALATVPMLLVLLLASLLLLGSTNAAGSADTAGTGTAGSTDTAAGAVGAAGWEPPARTVVGVSGSAADGFTITRYDGSRLFPPTDSEARAECGEYDRRIARVRCLVEVATWYRDLGDLRLSLRWARTRQ